MSLISLCLLIICSTLICILIHHRQKQREEEEAKFSLNVPSIPFAFPFLGNILQLGERAYETMQRWSYIYGPIYSLYLGQQQVVVLNRPELIREALITYADEFAGRPKLYMTHSTLKGKGLISSPYNSDFFEHKKFLIQKINKFGRRRSSLETNCLQTIRETLDDYRERIDRNFEYSNNHLKNSLSQITSQNVLTMTFGPQMHNKETLRMLTDLIMINFKSTSIAAAFNFLPVARIFRTFIFKVNFKKLTDPRTVEKTKTTLSSFNHFIRRFGHEVI